MTFVWVREYFGTYYRLYGYVDNGHRPEYINYLVETHGAHNIIQKVYGRVI
jgi:hypothetical protein